MISVKLLDCQIWVAGLLTAFMLTGTASTVMADAAGQVTVYRDDWGVPHAYADREEDGFYGLGYAQAEDRLEGMLQYYLVLRGEMAAHFGPEMIESDVNVLRYRHLAESRIGFAKLDPQLQQNYRQFIAGIERFMHDHPEQVPEWAPPLEPALVIAAARSILWGRTIFDALVGWRKEGSYKAKCALQPEPAQISFAPKATGSNEWVLMPWRTADGAVIHLGDPHGGLSGANEFRIDAGPMKAASSNFPTMALPFIGHTRNVAWAYTLGGPDVSDCYEVIVDANNPQRFQYDGEWQDMIAEEVTIQVKDQEPVTRTLEYTRHNNVLSPVVERRGDRAWVVSIPMMHEAGLLDQQMYHMVLAKNMQEFRAAIEPGLFAVNMMAGGADGNTLYVRGGRVPVRPSGYDWTRPVPGNSSATAWEGVHPFADLIRVENPEVGYMQNTNVAPDMMMASGSPRAEDYPVYLFNDPAGATNSRARRAIEMLSQTYYATVEDALERALDEKWLGTGLWQAALHKAVNAAPQQMASRLLEFRRVVDRILGFDGLARKESVAALNYYYWRTAFRTLPDSTEADVIALGRAIEDGQPVSASQHRLLLAAVDVAITNMNQLHGGVDLQFGDVFRAGRGGESWPMGGASFQSTFPVVDDLLHGDWFVTPMRAMSFSPPDENGQRWVRGGGYHTTLTVFTDPIQSFSALPLGQSGVPDSPYYSNQAKLISDRRLKPTYFYREQLLQHLDSETVLDIPPSAAE